MARAKKPVDGSRPLHIARHEKFAHELVKAQSAGEAFAAAGYAPDPKNVDRLRKRPDIQARVAFLQGRAAERVVVTVEGIARQLDEDRAFARDRGQGATAVMATMGKAKVLGLIVDKHVVGMKRIEDMNELELRALLGAIEAGK